MSACESPTLERRAAERGKAAANGLAQAEKGLRFETMGADAVAHALTTEGEDAGHRLGLAGGGGADGNALAPTTKTNASGPGGGKYTPQSPQHSMSQNISERMRVCVCSSAAAAAAAVQRPVAAVG